MMSDLGTILTNTNLSIQQRIDAYRAAVMAQVDAARAQAQQRASQVITNIGNQTTNTGGNTVTGGGGTGGGTGGGGTAPPGGGGSPGDGGGGGTGGTGGGGGGGNTPGPATLSSTQQDGFAYLNVLLNAYGLGSLSGWARDQIIAGNSPDMVAQLLRERDEFRQRFPAIFTRQQQGLPPISPDEYLSFERTARQMMQQYGLPSGFYDQPEDFTRYLERDVSVDELQQRVQLYQQAVFEQPPEWRAAMQTFYGVDAGQLTAYWIDPNRALPMLKQQMIAAQQSVSARISGYGALTRDEAERFGLLGISPEQALQGFQTLVSARELFTALPGEVAAGIDRAQQLGVIEGNQVAMDMVEQAARRRLAAFQGGGGYQVGQKAIAGMGSVSG